MISDYEYILCCFLTNQNICVMSEIFRKLLSERTQRAHLYLILILQPGDTTGILLNSGGGVGEGLGRGVGKAISRNCCTKILLLKCPFRHDLTFSDLTICTLLHIACIYSFPHLAELLSYSLQNILSRCILIFNVRVCGQ